MVDATKTSKLQEYRYALTVGAGSIVIFLILVFAIGSPLYGEYKKNSAELKNKKAVLAKLEDKLENLRGLKDKESEIREKNKKVLAALPSDKDVSGLFVQFENIANLNGLAISSVQESTTTQAAQTSNPGSVRAVSYNVSATAADYASLKNALGKLELALRILNISKVEASGNLADPSLNITLTVSTFVRSE